MTPDIASPNWGISASDGLWPVTIRILFVIDGRVKLTTNEFHFGLGFVLDTLRAVWSWWIRFEIDIATREESISPESLGTNSVRYTNFRFTFPDFDINRYDQVWFFADRPNDNDGADITTDQHIVPPFTLEDSELKLIAEWMDRGGGVFATGDHGVLGASLCSRIPRVRTMRRWKRSQDVPSRDGSRRHQTLQGEANEVSEGDTLLQPVELVYRASAYRPPFFPQFEPHPILCSSWGPVDRFPDHMHEGDLVADHLVELDQPLDIAGYDRPQYPIAKPEVIAAGAIDVGDIRLRPRPQIIAYGQTTNRYFPDEIALARGAELSGAPTVFLSKRFGLVSVYDGNPANVGRVVCDSTWHHWFSMNLAGIAKNDIAAFRKAQAYYRNVGLWLAGREQRQSMLVSAIWGALIGSVPDLFARHQNEWEMGVRASRVLQHTMPPCWIDEVVAAFLDYRTASLRYLSGDASSSEPRWSAFPGELVRRAMVGSLCNAIFDLVLEHRSASDKRGGVKVDPAKIRKQAAQGAKRGIGILRQCLDDAARSIGALRDKLATVENPGADNDRRY